MVFVGQGRDPWPIVISGLMKMERPAGEQPALEIAERGEVTEHGR